MSIDLELENIIKEILHDREMDYGRFLSTYISKIKKVFEKEIK